MTAGKFRTIVRGVGSALPEHAVSNDELAKTVETSDAWIQQRTGIRQRYIAGDHETTSTLGAKASERALAAAGLKPDDIDLILVGTSTPDYTFPSAASQIQALLGITRGAAFDLQAVCSGFVYALATADKFLASGANQRALVIGAETFSRLMDWEDRTTCVLFGDGAGALVVEAVEDDGAAKPRGVLASRLRADGRHRAKLFVDGGPSTTKTVGHLRMEGREVYKYAVAMVGDVVAGCFADAGLNVADLDWFVPHQANRRIIEASAERFGVDLKKVVITVDRHGNTSAASIPLALDVAVKDGRIKAGDLVMIEAIGGGFTWGAALIRW